MKRKVIIVFLVLLILPISFVNIFAQNNVLKDLSIGLEKESQGDCLSAIFIYRDILAKNKYFLDAKIALARCYLKTGNLKEAENTLKDALKQDKKNVLALNLLGRVYIAQKQFDKAKESFENAIRIEPVNIEAKYGLADLYRAKRDYPHAINIYNKLIKIYPQEVWTYIYLGIAYTEMDNLPRAGGFFRKAVSLDSQSKWTHLNLANHYYRMGIDYSKKDPESSEPYFDAAIHEADTALRVDRSFGEAYRVLSDVHFYRKDYKKAIDNDKKLIGRQKNDAIIYYEIGFANEMLNNLEDAKVAYERSLDKKIYDEVTRYRFEGVLLSLKRRDLKDKKRIELAKYHLDKGRFYLDRNLFDKAFIHYKRAVQLDPANPVKRIELSEFYRIRGLNELYIYELKNIIRDTLDINTVDINDKVEIYESRISKSISNKWNVKQYIDKEDSIQYFPKTNTRIAVFDYFLSNCIEKNFIHKRLSKTLKEMIEDVLAYYPKIEVVHTDRVLDSPDEALKLARSLGVDLYIFGKVDEKEDSITVNTSIASGSNGKVIKGFKTYFTGNDKLFNTVISIAKRINRDIPLRGMIVRMDGNKALINIGKAHGVDEDMQFLIFRKGGLVRDQETGEFILNSEVALGELKITEVDEMVSEGEYKHKGIYNRVNINDSVILMEEKEGKDKESKESTKK